jgi:NAD(P)-dependent dehydrogenase (short-subunit alcohol dehydrogenase family)
LPVAVVTGASSGIGEAISRELARRDWHVVLLARREDRLQPLASEFGGEYELCDVGRRADVERVAAAVTQRHPSIQLLVNNAGIPGRAGFTKIELERLEEVLRVNYLGPVWCLRAFLPALEAAAPSDVVNVVSVAGTVAAGSGGPYTSSKHAQLAFSRSVAASCGRAAFACTRSCPASSRPRASRSARVSGRGSRRSSSSRNWWPSACSRHSTATAARCSSRAGTAWLRSRKPWPRGSLHGWPLAELVRRGTRMNSSPTSSPPLTSHPSQSSAPRCADSSAPRSETPARLA